MAPTVRPPDLCKGLKPFVQPASENSLHLWSWAKLHLECLVLRQEHVICPADPDCICFLQHTAQSRMVTDGQ